MTDDDTQTTYHDISNVQLKKHALLLHKPNKFHRDQAKQVATKLSMQIKYVHTIFTVQSNYASEVLGIVILSVHPSVYHTHDCDKMKEHAADILIPYERVITLVF